MKQLNRIRLINWHLFENTTITCRGTTYFIGVNGAGKSTILDAIQFVLVGGQRDVKFNRAAMDGSKRTLAGYVRGELGTEGQRYLRGDATAIVALEFLNSDGTPFVHGAVIDAFQDNRSPDLTYFIVNDAPLNDAWFFRGEGQLFDSRQFRRHMEHFALPGGRVQLFTRLEDYRFHLLNRLGQLKETFPAKIVKGLAFSPLTNIRDFVHNYLLDENLVDVHILREQLETMRHFETLAANIRQRITHLNQIAELDEERVSQRRLRLINGYIHRHAASDVHLVNLKQYRLERDQGQVDLSRLNLKRDNLAERLKHARQELLDAQIALHSDITANKANILRQEIGRLQTELADLRQRENRIRQILAHELEDARRLQTFLTQDGVTTPTSLITFVETNLSSFTQHAALVSQLQVDLQTLSNDYASRLALIEDKSRELRQEAEQLQREIHQLRTGDRDVSYEAAAPQATQLRRLLRAELNLSGDEVIYFCTALHIPDETWQDAAEGILGNARFDLLVPPENYDSGPWQLVDSHGQITSLADFYPSVGIPAALAASVQQVSVDAPGVICVENLTPFYELIRHQGVDWAAICLWGNPSPACRHLLHRLAETLPQHVPLYLWADIDYGGLNILAHLRQQVSRRFIPYHMDCPTLEAHVRWAHPLSSTDERNLTRLKHHPALEDVTALIDYMLARGLKLEQEAVIFDSS